MCYSVFKMFLSCFKMKFSRCFSSVSRWISRAFISYGIAKYSWRMLIESVDLFGSTLLGGRHSLLPSSAILFLNPRTWCWGTLAWWALQLPSFNKHRMFWSDRRQGLKQPGDQCWPIGMFVFAIEWPFCQTESWIWKRKRNHCQTETTIVNENI